MLKSTLATTANGNPLMANCSLKFEAVDFENAMLNVLNDFENACCSGQKLDFHFPGSLLLIMEAM